MNLSDFKELLEKYNVTPEKEPTEDMPVVDLGIDSFDLLMILGDIETDIGKQLGLTLDTTVGEVLAKVTEAKRS